MIALASAFGGYIVVIILITGPSGIGKTDTCFNLLTAVKNSVYLDSDWFSAKNPIDPLSKERIMELYELLKLNINYHIAKDTQYFFIAIYLEAAERLLEYPDVFMTLGQKIRLVVLTCNRHALESRVMSRDRIDEQKQAELGRLSTELEQMDRLVQSTNFGISIDTSRLTTQQVADIIIKRCSVRI